MEKIEKVMTDKIKDEFIANAKKIQWNLKSVHNGIDVEKNWVESILSFWNVYGMMKQFVENQFDLLFDKILENLSLIKDTENMYDYNEINKVVILEKWKMLASLKELRDYENLVNTSPFILW